jgi:hypothetical protein
MKKLILIIIFIIQVFSIYSQSLDAEQKYLDSISMSGKYYPDLTLLRKKWNAFITNYKYPELKVNNITGEADISDILTFTNLDKQTIYQRCLQWIAINYGALIHNDLPSGKIIANGLLDLTHFAEYEAAFGSKKVHQINTPTNYTMILTIKDNKIKYCITNITFTFTSYSAESEANIDTSLPVFSLYPIVAKDQIQWVSYTTLLNECINKFQIKLKSALSDYVKDVQNDYNF